MPTPPLSDDQLREAARAYLENGCVATNAADALGVNRKTFQNRIERAKARGFLLSPGAMGQVERARLNPIEAKGGWIHQYDDEGKKVGTTRWAATEIEQEALFDRIRSAVNGIAPVAAIAAPDHAEADLLSLYPLADIHFGLLAWGDETGEDFDTALANERVGKMIGQAVALSPPSQTAIILALGDTTHANDTTYQTPKSKHVLDGDTRHFRTLEVAISALGAAIETAAQKHERVVVRILPGNHDPEAYLAIMFALAERYADNERIQVQKVPGEFFVHHFGKVMLCGHHGDKAKPPRLVQFFADEFAEIWGKTRHRHMFTGHLHHYRAQDMGGMQHEQFRAIAARDAYAVSYAYSARADMQAITYHRQHGEVSRVRVPA